MLCLVINVINAHCKINTHCKEKQPSVTKNRKRERGEGEWKQEVREERWKEEREEGRKEKERKKKRGIRSFWLILPPKINIIS